jgi:hypothetical protein
MGKRALPVHRVLFIASRAGWSGATHLSRISNIFVQFVQFVQPEGR